MHSTIGTCSLCGGAVVVPSVWLGIIPPTPECSRCGATPKESHGPVIDMQRSGVVPMPWGPITITAVGTSKRH